MGCRFFLQGIFPTQGSNLSLLHLQEDSHHWASREAPLLKQLISKTLSLQRMIHVFFPQTPNPMCILSWVLSAECGLALGPPGLQNYWCSPRRHSQPENTSPAVMNSMSCSICHFFHPILPGVFVVAMLLLFIYRCVGLLLLLLHQITTNSGAESNSQDSSQGSADQTPRYGSAWLALCLEPRKGLHSTPEVWICFLCLWGCWLNPVPCGCFTEAPDFLLAVGGPLPPSEASLWF